MHKLVQTDVGRLILQQAHDAESSHVITRLPPQNAKDLDAGYVMMFLDWDQQVILHVELDKPELIGFHDAVTELVNMEILDAFDPKDTFQM